MFLSSFIFFASSGFRPVSESCKKRSLSSLYKGTEPKTCVAQDPQVSAGRALMGTQFLLQVLQGCMAVSHPDTRRDNGLPWGPITAARGGEITWVAHVWTREMAASLLAHKAVQELATKFRQPANSPECLLQGAGGNREPAQGPAPRGERKAKRCPHG